MKIDNEILSIQEQLEKDKKYFFEHPEIGNKEIETSKYIIKRLKKMGYKDIKQNIYTTGIVATLKGKEQGECILFRSEMDAVQMDNTGRTKHTCGHHAHMSCLLGLAQILINNKNQIKGTIKLLFQPDEEGNGGAKQMIEKGVLENPKVDKVFAIHVWSELKENTICLKSGPLMASTDPFEIEIKGKGGHAAIPEKCVDPIYIASKISTKIKEMSKIDINENEKIVLGITAINGGQNNNVIPDNVYLKGICRTFNNEIRENIKKELIDKVNEISKQYSGEANVNFIGNYPATINSKKVIEDLIEITRDLDCDIVKDYTTMCSEDFSYFLENTPGAMIFIGCGKDIYYPQHNENFTVGINPVCIGLQVLYNIVKKYSL